MKFMLIYLLLRSLMGFSPLTIIVLLLLAALWLLDSRFTGFIPALLAPFARTRRIAGLRHALEVNPLDVRAHVDLGELYLQGGKPQLAVEHLERAADRGENGARATYLLGATWVRLGRHAAGKERLQAALAQTPNIAYGEPYLFLLEAALATGGDAGQVEALVAELTHFESVEVLARAGQLCARAGHKEVGRRLLTEAVRNYELTPRSLRRRQRRWMLQARLALMRLG